MNVKQWDKDIARSECAEAMNSDEYKPDIKTNLMSGKIEGKPNQKCMK